MGVVREWRVHTHAEGWVRCRRSSSVRLFDRQHNLRNHEIGRRHLRIRAIRTFMRRVARAFVRQNDAPHVEEGIASLRCGIHVDRRSAIASRVNVVHRDVLAVRGVQPERDRR